MPASASDRSTAAPTARPTRSLLKSGTEKRTGSKPRGLPRTSWQWCPDIRGRWRRGRKRHRPDPDPGQRRRDRCRPRREGLITHALSRQSRVGRRNVSGCVRVVVVRGAVGERPGLPVAQHHSSPAVETAAIESLPTRVRPGLVAYASRRRASVPIQHRTVLPWDDRGSAQLVCETPAHHGDCGSQRRRDRRSAGSSLAGLRVRAAPHLQPRDCRRGWCGPGLATQT
jgi:hypothetical protein